MSKLITAKQAAELIADEAALAVATVGLSGWPQEIANSISDRFHETGHPKNLTFIHSCTCGDHLDNRNGSNSLAHEGLVTRLICAHTGSSIYMSRLVTDNKMQCYLFPQGVFPQMYRSVSGGKPGVITKVGLHTFVDPRIDGGKANDITTEDMVELIELGGEEWLWYKNFDLDVALLRGTCCDEKGNMTLDEEIAFMEMLPLASAVKNRGGIVIAQVKYIATADSIHPKRVKLPGSLIDYIVVTSDPALHMQTQRTTYSPVFAGDIKVPLGTLPHMPLDERKVIVRRAAMELRKGYFVNLGIGMPMGISSVVAEEGFAESIVLSTETGAYGGTPATGREFGATYNPEAIIEHAAMFDWIDGGGLDVTFLGMAQMDQHGNVNVSKVGSLTNGPGGFINISQSTRNIVFCGSFCIGARLSVGDGRIIVEQEGKSGKFVQNVAQITFSGEYAAKTGQNILVITERCVFRLRNKKLTLVEIAPGIDLQRDILEQMAFAPEISRGLREMPAELFRERWGGLGE